MAVRVVISETKLTDFILKVFKYFYRKDNLQSFVTYFEASRPRNGSGTIIKLKKDNIKLTGLFISTNIGEINLRNGNAGHIRWFTDEFRINNIVYYLSSQWNANGNYQLTLDKLKYFVGLAYGDRYLLRETDGENFEFLIQNDDAQDDYVSDGPELISVEESSMQNDSAVQANFKTLSVIDAINKTGLLYDDKLLKRYICSLMTKPFVILSGLAGSGKTQLALAFARVMSENIEDQLCVVPVGADWTNREPLLGYPNALKSDEYVMPESGVLQIMMRALDNPDKPYFLVLDEMNLSYVERYFADFLSALESHEDIPLWDKPEECISEVHAKIALPKNLYIIGTINVDETTYMFSPKVLDRANVIEFKISDADMEKFLGSDINVDIHASDGACSNMGKDFVEKSTDKTVTDNQFAKEALLEFFKVLKSVNAEFGFRSATEIYRFISKAKAYADSMSDDEIIDAAIVQKLLPKLHGSRKKLDGALKALWKLCITDDQTRTDVQISLDAAKEAKYKESADKICRMYETACNNGFTSFAEA